MADNERPHDPSTVPLGLPPDATLVRTTAEFDEHTVPAGLRHDHQIAAGVWGRLVVRSGALRFGFEDDAVFDVVAGESVVIPPRRMHHVAIFGAVRFVVEFHRRPDTVLS